MNFKEFINICKIKKITAIELSVLFIVFIALGIYYSPRFWHKQEVMMAAKIKADSAVFTSKALEEFATNKKAKSSEVAQKVTDELIYECAKLAKEYSVAKASAKVGVIYTKRKYLRKPPKANLGYVTYRNESEIIV